MTTATGPDDAAASPRVRAELLDTGERDLVRARIVIDAPAARVFDLIADPRRHPDLDGSGTVRGVITGPERLALGARFAMVMRMGIPYRVTNTVVEFEEGRRIAWRHLARNVWRYEVVDLGDGRTEVTETADLRTAIHRPLIALIGAPRAAAVGMARTLVRLKALAEGTAAAAAD